MIDYISAKRDVELAEFRLKEIESLIYSPTSPNFAINDRARPESSDVFAARVALKEKAERDLTAAQHRLALEENKLAAFLTTLDYRESVFVAFRYKEGRKLSDIAKLMHYSLSTVRRLNKKIELKLNRYQE